MVNKAILASTSRLPSPIEELIKTATLVKQGAEAKVYKAILTPSPSIYYPSPSPSSSTSPSAPIAPHPILLKHRFSKAYRHTTLDVLLTRQRLSFEARALVKCQKMGVTVPGLRIVDISQGTLGMEWIEGWSVREVLGGGQDDDEGAWEEGKEVEGEEEEEEYDSEAIREKLKGLGVDEESLLRAIGEQIARMHLAEVIHGDLTTSNMMVRLLPLPAHSATSTPNDPSPIFEVVLIDFGLSSISFIHEDRAVDLYVLERAFASTHPIPEGEGAEPQFEKVLRGYKRVLEEKGKKGEWERVEKRLEEVRLRGRKRSMVG